MWYNSINLQAISKLQLLETHKKYYSHKLVIIYTGKHFVLILQHNTKFQHCKVVLHVLNAFCSPLVTITLISMLTNIKFCQCLLKIIGQQYLVSPTFSTLLRFINFTQNAESEEGVTVLVGVGSPKKAEMQQGGQLQE